MQSGWGTANTKFFFELTPDQVISAVESLGLLCTGACFALNSYENRVYEVELEPTAENEDLHPIHRKRVVKFYRPGRWTQEQILEEHEFLQDLADHEVPVVNTVRVANGSTIHTEPKTGLFYTLFPKVGGRIPQEPTEDQLMQIGRLIARLHNVGETKKANHRIELNVNTYGLSNLEFLMKNQWINREFESRYEKAVRSICELIDPVLERLPKIRLHGDCHLGNLLENNEQIFFLDFDDMLSGPPVQDLWLLMSESGRSARTQWEILLEGYEQMRTFDRSSLKVVEGLRALRMVHFTAWLARRWDDPAFPKNFGFFKEAGYWQNQTSDLEDQLLLLQEEM